MNVSKHYTNSMFEDGATDRTGDVGEAFPAGDRGCTLQIIT